MASRLKMSEKNSTSLQFSTVFKTMSIVGLLLLLAVYLNYSRGSKEQSSSALTPNYRTFNGPLSSMLTEQYSTPTQLLSSTPSSVQFKFPDAESDPTLNTIDEGDESVLNSRIANMLEVLEYEKLKSFLRKFSMKTLRRLRKLISTDPDAGQRYLVKLVQKRGPGVLNPYISGDGSSAFPALDNKELIKIATVIFEPEFLEMAEVEEDDSNNSAYKLDNKQASSNTNTSDFTQQVQNAPEWLNGGQFEDPMQHFTEATQIPATISPNGPSAPTKYYVPYYSQASNANFDQDKPYFKPSKQFVEDFEPSHGLPQQMMTAPIPFPTVPTFPPSLNFKNFIKTLHQKTRPKPIVEFMQVAKNPNKVQIVRNAPFELQHVNTTNTNGYFGSSGGGTGLESQRYTKRHPVSFHISSILAAQNKSTAYGSLVEHGLGQQHYDYDYVADQRFYDTYRNQWTNSDSEFGGTNGHLHPFEYEYYDPQESHMPHLTWLKPKQGLSDFSKQKWNRHGLPALEVSQSPYDTSYMSYKPISSYQYQPTESPYGSGPPLPPYGPPYTPIINSYHYDGNGHPFENYGDGELNLHVNHFENYPSVPQTQQWDIFSVLVNATKSVLNSLTQGSQSPNSSGMSKVLGISLSALAFLAFGTYITVLLLRGLAPTLFLPSSTNQSTTNLGGMLFGRNQAVPQFSMRSSDSIGLVNELEKRLILSLNRFVESLAVNERN